MVCAVCGVQCAASARRAVQWTACGGRRRAARCGRYCTWRDTDIQAIVPYYGCGEGERADRGVDPLGVVLLIIYPPVHTEHGYGQPGRGAEVRMRMRKRHPMLVPYCVYTVPHHGLTCLNGRTEWMDGCMYAFTYLSIIVSVHYCTSERRSARREYSLKVSVR